MRKMRQNIVWRPGSARTRWGRLSAPPDSLAAMKGPNSMGKGREGKGRKGRGGKGREKRERGREGRERKSLPRFEKNSGYGPASEDSSAETSSLLTVSKLIHAVPLADSHFFQDHRQSHILTK